MEYHGNFSAANRQGENEVLEVLMDENEMIMTDEELMVACEFTPYNRQSTLIPLLLEASCAAKVAAPYVRRLSTVQERAVFALHSMYLLGVQRGAEAYRSAIQPEKDISWLPCMQDEGDTEDTIEEIAERKMTDLNEITHLFGLIFLEKGAAILD